MLYKKENGALVGVFHVEASHDCFSVVGHSLNSDRGVDTIILSFLS